MAQEPILAITVDIEDWYHVPTVTGSPFARFRTVEDFFGKWMTRYDYLAEPTQHVLDLFHKFRITATFFVVADVVDHYPRLVERIAECGHEIACHGLHHTCIIHPGTKEPLISQRDFEHNMAQAKAKLEQAAGQEVIGFRAPNAFIAGWMLDSLENMGFRYDSSVSVNSLYAKMPSRPKDVRTIPYYPEHGNLDIGGPRRILEMPWPYWQFLGLRLPTAGGPFLRFLGSEYIIRGLEQSLLAGHSVFYFHPLDISAEDFPSGFSARRPFYWSIKGKAVKKRVEKILDRFYGQLGTCQDILARVESEARESQASCERQLRLRSRSLVDTTSVIEKE